MASSRRTPSRGNVTDIAEAREQKANLDAKDTTSAEANTSSNRKFDHDKVAAIKAAIANGTYQINAQRIADKFIEQESP